MGSCFSLALKKRPFLSLTLFALIFATIASYLEGWGWPLALFTHFRAQYVMGLAGTAVFALYVKQGKVAVSAALFCLLNLTGILPLYTPMPETAVSPPTYRAVSLNVHHENLQYQQVITFIRQTNPDFFVLVEAPDTWVEAMQPLRTVYPYLHRAYYEGHESRMIFSQHPFVATDEVQDAERPSAVVQLDLNGRSFTLIAAHLSSPVRPENTPKQQQQLADLAAYITHLNTPVMVLGDLNTTPWSAVFRQLVQESGLENGRIGFGIQPTWPVFLPLIPIDHALVSPGITIHQFQTGPFVGSDHYPILVEFSIE